MIRYNQIVKNIYTEDEQVKLGEFNMINTMEGQVCIYDEYNSGCSEFERTFKLYQTSKLLAELSDSIDLKATQLKESLGKFEQFIKKSQWLDVWTNKTKKDILLQANSGLLALDNDKLDKLQKRIYRYERYFELMEKEEDEFKRYEYTFNFLTQIPIQINLYVEEATNKNEKFEAKPNIYRDTVETSSLGDVFYFGMKYEIALAA